MSERRRVQATIPEPYEDVPSLYRAVRSMKELVEVLAGQRGGHEDWAVTFGELPALPATGDSRWHPFAYLNGWVDYSAPYSPCGYRKLSSGLVLLRGLVMSGTAAQICQLPKGYRPGIQMLYAAETNPNVLCRVDVTTGGVVSHQGGSNAYLSLNNVCFLAEG